MWFEFECTDDGGYALRLALNITEEDENALRAHSNQQQQQQRKICSQIMIIHFSNKWRKKCACCCVQFSRAPVFHALVSSYNFPNCNKKKGEYVRGRDAMCQVWNKFKSWIYIFFLSVVLSISLVLCLACSLCVCIYSASICCTRFFRRSLNFLSFIARWLCSVSHSCEYACFGLANGMMTGKGFSFSRQVRGFVLRISCNSPPKQPKHTPCYTSSYFMM